MSRSHKITTFLGLAAKTPSFVWTMSISDMEAGEAGWSEAEEGVIERRHWRKVVVVVNLKEYKGSWERGERGGGGELRLRVRVSMDLQSKFI